MKVIYEEGSRTTSRQGEVFVRLTEYATPDNQPLYILESEVTDKPFKTSGDTHRSLALWSTELLFNGNPWKYRCEAIREAIARFDDLAKRFPAPVEE